MAKSSIIPEKIKICTNCKVAFSLSCFYTTGKKRDGSPKYNSWCKECISKKQASYHKRTWGPEALQYSAQKRTKTVRSYLAYLLAKARRRRGTTITLDYLEALWVAQKGLCAISGRQMTRILGRGVINTNASIDRIRSDKDYEANNVQLVCRIVNLMKQDLDVDEFVSVCREIVERADAEDTSMAA